MISPDEALMGALPFIPQSPVNSLNIAQGTAGTAPGTAAAVTGGTANVTTGATGTAVLIAWFLILFILVACNIFTLRVQR